MGSHKKNLPKGNVNQTGFDIKPKRFKKGHADIGSYKPKWPGMVETGYALKSGGNYSNGRFPRKVKK